MQYLLRSAAAAASSESTVTSTATKASASNASRAEAGESIEELDSDENFIFSGEESDDGPQGDGGVNVNAGDDDEEMQEPDGAVLENALR